jgi:hypothetical protein
LSTLADHNDQGKSSDSPVECLRAGSTPSESDPNMNPSPSPLKQFLHNPHLWLWLGAGCLVASLASLWSPAFESIEVTVDSPVARAEKLPVLSSDRVPEEPRLYPFRLAKKAVPEATRSSPVTPAAHIDHPLKVEPSATTAQSIIRADWRTESPDTRTRVQQISASYVESGPPEDATVPYKTSPTPFAPAWLAGTIEPADQPAEIPRTTRPPTPSRYVTPPWTNPAIQAPPTVPSPSVNSPPVDPRDQLPIIIPAGSDRR